jgi:hypothetical protein
MLENIQSPGLVEPQVAGAFLRAEIAWATEHEGVFTITIRNIDRLLSQEYLPLYQHRYVFMLHLIMVNILSPQ